jgi:hypothetical protein
MIAIAAIRMIPSRWLRDQLRTPDRSGAKAPLH